MSYFTEPIYFSSIILGSLYHADHLSRAMYQRITEIEDLPQSFSLNRPLLSGEKQTALLQMICHLTDRAFSSIPGHLYTLFTSHGCYRISGEFEGLISGRQHCVNSVGRSGNSQ